MQIYALKMFVAWDGFVVYFVTNKATEKYNLVPLVAFSKYLLQLVDYLKILILII